MKNTTVTTMTSEQFDMLVVHIKRAGKLTADMIQRAAVFAIYQSIEHRNSTPADMLYKAMPDGTRKNSLAAYFEQHGNLAYVKGDKAKPIHFFDVQEMTGREVAFNEALLMGEPWHKAAKEQDYTSAWDVKEKLDKLLSQLERAVKNEERPVINQDLIKKVREVMAAGAAS